MKFSFLSVIFFLAFSHSVVADSIRPAVESAAATCDNEKLEIIGKLNGAEKSAERIVSLPFISLGRNTASFIEGTEHAKKNSLFPKDKLAEHERSAAKCIQFVKTAKAMGGDMNHTLIGATEYTAEFALELGANPSAIRDQVIFGRKMNNTYGMVAVKSIVDSAKGTGPIQGVLEAVKLVAAKTKDINHVNSDGKTMLALVMDYWDARITDPVILELVKMGAKTTWNHKGKSINAMDLYKGSNIEVLRLLKPN